MKKPKKESKTSLKSVDSTSTNLSSNATFADRSLAETTVNVSAISTSPSFTKTYDYTEDEHGVTKKRKPVGGFTYESNTQKSKENISEIPTSPSKRAQGLAFNYAPGEGKKVAETAAEKRKTFMDKIATDGLKTPGINYVQSAVNKEESVKKEPKTSVETKLDSKISVVTKVDPKLSVETKLDPKTSDETKVEPAGEIKFTKTVLEKKVTSANTETTFETEKKKVDPKSGIFNKKSKENDGGKGVLGKAMDKLGSFGKGSKDKTEVDVKKESSDFIENERKIYEDDKPTGVSTAPLIVKTTTKQTMIKDKEGVTQNIEEKVEDLMSGEVTVSTQHNKVILAGKCWLIFIFIFAWFCFMLLRLG